MLASPPEGVAPLTLKAGIHTGPCIAVTLNDRLDYFGSTVNHRGAARGFIDWRRRDNFARALRGSGSAQSSLNPSELSAGRFDIELKGFDQERFELWRVARAKEVATDAHG